MVQQLVLLRPQGPPPVSHETVIYVLTICPLTRLPEVNREHDNSARNALRRASIRLKRILSGGVRGQQSADDRFRHRSRGCNPRNDDAYQRASTNHDVSGDPSYAF